MLDLPDAESGHSHPIHKSGVTGVGECPLVLMPMMQIRVVRVRVAQRGMTMPVPMRLRHRAIMRVPVMVVMCVAVFVA